MLYGECWFCSICLMLASCEEKGLLVSSNDTAYLKFANDMTRGYYYSIF